MSLDDHTLEWVIEMVETKLRNYQHSRKRYQESDQPNMAISANGSVIACFAIIADLTGESVQDLLKKYGEWE